MCLSFKLLAVSDELALVVWVMLTGFTSSSFDLALMLLTIISRTEVELVAFGLGPSYVSCKYFFTEAGSFVDDVALVLLKPVLQLDCGQGDDVTSGRGGGGDVASLKGVTTSHLHCGVA